MNRAEYGEPNESYFNCILVVMLVIDTDFLYDALHAQENHSMFRYLAS